MRTFKRFCWFTLLIGILIVALTSCGSKKKVVEKEEEKIEIEIIDKKEEKKDVEKETKKEEKKETDTKDENFYFEIEDANKEFEIEKEEKDGKTTWKGKNVKIVDFTKKETKEQKKSTEETKEKETTEKKTDLKEKVATNKKSTNKDLEVKRGFPWWILAVFGVVYLALSLFKKTFNPLSWFL